MRKYFQQLMMSKQKQIQPNQLKKQSQETNEIQINSNRLVEISQSVQIDNNNQNRLSIQQIQMRGFSDEYLRMTKKYKVNKLIPNNQVFSKSISIKSSFDISKNIQQKDLKQFNSNILLNKAKTFNSKIHFKNKQLRTKNLQRNYLDHKSIVNIKRKQDESQQLSKKMQNLMKSINYENKINKTLNQNNILFLQFEDIKPPSFRQKHQSQYKHKKGQQKISFFKKSRYSPIKQTKSVHSPQKDENENSNHNQNQSEFRRTKLSQNKQKVKLSFNHKRLKSLGMLTASSLVNKQHKQRLLNRTAMSTKAKTQNSFDKTQHSFDKTKNSFCKRKVNSFDSKKVITYQLEIQQSKKSLTIFSQGIIGNYLLICAISQCFQPKSFINSTLPFQKLTSLLKLYVFGQEKTQTQSITSNRKSINKLSNYKNLLFSHADQVFFNDKACFRQFVCVEKLLILCVVGLIGISKLVHLYQEVKAVFDLLIQVYQQLLRQALQFQSFKGIQLRDKIELAIKNKQPFSLNKSLSHTLKFELIPYLENIYRYFPQLLSVYFNPILQLSKLKTINRTFYQILKVFAMYLTHNQQKLHQNHVENKLLSTFFTCPAPYLTSKSLKPYSLVLDLDQTLLHSFFINSKYTTLYRPGAYEFIQHLSKYFQIIVFTSAVKEYADLVLKQFQGYVDHLLTRYHVTRITSGNIKDLARIGRDLTKIIFIDDLQANAKLQPNNHIAIKPWTGDTNDTQLYKIKHQLLKIVKSVPQHEDIRYPIKQLEININK